MRPRPRSRAAPGLHGRLAVRTAPLCKAFGGVDISSKTIRRARENLHPMPNATLIYAGFDLTKQFETPFAHIFVATKRD